MLETVRAIRHGRHYRQGNTLAAHPARRAREGRTAVSLFFRYDSKAQDHLSPGSNDEQRCARAGSKSDPYGHVRKMLDSGNPPARCGQPGCREPV